MGTLGYGTDLHCSSDLLETMDEITDPTSVEILAEAITRRLDTPAGGLIDDPLYGLDLRAFLNRGTADSVLRQIENQVRGEVEADDRVDQATVSVAFGANFRSMTVTIRIVAVDPATGTFSMTLTVTSAAVVLEAIAA
jgi:hypothetical protein